MREIDATTIIQSIVTGFLVGGIYGVITIGLDVIFGVLDLVDLARGEFLMISMYISYFFFNYYKFNVFILMLMVPIVFAILAVPTYFGLYNFLAGKEHPPQMLFTASLSIVLQNLALVLWKSDPRTLKTPLRMSSIVIGSILINKALLLSFVFSIISTIIVFYFLYKTELGSVIRATINNRTVITLLGIDSKRVYLMSFVLGSILTAFGGVLLSLYYPVSPFVGHIYNSFMWIALVLGGAGTIRGSLVGGFIIGVTQVVSATFLPINLQNVIALTLFIITIALKPEGLFGRN